MNYSIRHRTTYRYAEHVSNSHHLAHLTPFSNNSQTSRRTNLTITPEPDTLSSHLDSFQNLTHFFSITTPHKELVIESYSEVEVLDRGTDALLISPPWEEVIQQLSASTSAADLDAVGFSFPSPLCPRHPDLREYALQSFTPNRPVLDAAADLNSRIHQDFAFDDSATTVTTPVMEVFKKRAGVCQDFAHLQISCMISLGLPVRYVSGYIRTDPPPGKPRLVGADASHAWVDLYVPSLGWHEFDATNNLIPSLSHIRVAHGRDYHDICPVRGTVYGGGHQSLFIGVTVTPL